jgi:hypothetical protein
MMERIDAKMRHIHAEVLPEARRCIEQSRKLMSGSMAVLTSGVVSAAVDTRDRLIQQTEDDLQHFRDVLTASIQRVASNDGEITQLRGDIARLRDHRNTWAQMAGEPQAPPGRIDEPPADFGH